MVFTLIIKPFIDTSHTHIPILSDGIAWFTIKESLCIHVHGIFCAKKRVYKKSLTGVVYNDIAHRASLVVSVDGGGTGFPYV